VRLHPPGGYTWRNDYACRVSDALLTLLGPGLLNLVPVLGVSAPDRRARSAAILATILGALRLVVPALPVLSRWPRVVVVTGLSPPTFAPELDPSYWVSPILWLVSVGASFAFLWRARTEHV
jgi:hypothetical protein